MRKGEKLLMLLLHQGEDPENFLNMVSGLKSAYQEFDELNESSNALLLEEMDDYIYHFESCIETIKNSFNLKYKNDNWEDEVDGLFQNFELFEKEKKEIENEYCDNIELF